MSSHDCPQSDPTTLIVGRLVEVSTLRPLPGLTVVAREGIERNDVLRRAHTDADGRFELCLSSEDLRTLMTGAESPSFDATVYLAVWNGGEHIAGLSHVIHAGSVSRRIDVGEQAIEVPEETRTYTLRAIVVSAASIPLPGIDVELESVEIGSRTSLTTGTTDDDGQVELSYGGGRRASAADTDLRLQLTAMLDATELTRSPVLFSLKDGQEVRLVVASEVGTIPSERERITAAIAGPLGEAELGALALEDVEVLARVADVYPPHLALLVRATALAVEGVVEVDELYAMGRAGLPLTVAGLLAHDGSAFQSALARGFAHNIVPSPMDREMTLASIAGRMASWAGALTVDPATTTARWSNLEHSGVSAATREAFAAKWLTLTGSPAERWAAVAVDPALTAAAPALEFTAGASLLVGEHGPAVEALVQARAASEVETLRDLAAWSLSDWTTALDGVGVPPVLESRDPAADTERLARIAMRVLDVMVPSAGMGRQLAASSDGALAGAGRFLQDHADFDIDRSVPARYFAEHPEAFEAGEPGKAQLATLARVQRVHALAPAIERPLVTQALIGLGIESAGAVVRQGLDGFVDRHAIALDGVHPFMSGSQLAHAVFQQATLRHAATTAMMAQLGKAFHGTPMNVLPAIEWPEDEEDPANATLRALFGSQDYCACEHCRSVYGPAAYLVDLLALLESRPAIAPDEHALDVLRRRRPDITGLELSCANTNTVLPYVDLVLELLEARVVDPEVPPVARQTTRTAAELRLRPEHRLDGAYELAAEAVYPWGLPFDLHTERVRAYCAQLGATRLEAMHTLRRASEEAGGDAQMDRVAEALGLTPAALQLVSGATAYDTGVFPATEAVTSWGMVGGAWVTTLSNDVGQVIERSGLDFDGLRDRLALELVNPGQVAAVVFDEPSCDLADARIDAITAAVLDRLQRFVRLERATGLDPVMLDRALRGLGGALEAASLRALADARALAGRLQRPLVEVLVLWGSFDTQDYAGDPSPYARRFASRVLTPELDPAFALNSGGTELAHVVDLGEAHHPTIRAALSLSDAELQVLIAEVLPESPALSLATLSLLARHVVLARSMRVPVAELVVLLALVDVDPFASPADTDAFVEIVRSLHGAGLDTATLDYLARHRFSAAGGLDLSDEAIVAVLATLWAATQAAADADAAREDALVQGLAGALDLPSDATRVLAFELVHVGSHVAKDVLLDPDFLESGDPGVDQRSAYRRLHKAALVIRTLALPATALAWIFGSESAVAWLDLDALPLTEGEDPSSHIAGLRRLALAHGVVDELGSFEVWANAFDEVSLAAALATLAGSSTWDIADLEYVSSSAVLDLSSASELGEPQVLVRLREVATLVRRTGVRAAQLGAWVLPAATPAIADSLQAALKARYEDEATWSQVMAPIADRLRNAQRAALVGLLLGRGDFSDEIAIYDHYLVDPEMGACMLTSRLRLATSSVQLFIQRVLMNLEQDEVTFPPTTAERWAWMKSYRVWEANRKVFFYPENWIEPELRDDKTPFFEELEQHLQQGELTDAHVEAGYEQYLRKLHEVSHLEVPALCREQKDEHQVVHVLGRTRGLPPKYWYRTRVDDRVWTPWVEVPVDIPSNQVTVAAHNRRLFVLWVEAQQDSVKPQSEGETDMDFYQRVRIGWTELRGGTWAPKKLTSLSTRNTKSWHRVHAEELQIVAYERSDGALFVDVLYERDGTIQQCTMYRYDDCRDILEERATKIHYVPKDLGLSHGMEFDGQRHVRAENDMELDLLHYKWESQSYQAVGFLRNLPHTYWVTTAKQQRYYMGRTPVVFDDAERAFYIVPTTHWVHTDREPQGQPPAVPYQVDPWSAIGGVTSPVPMLPASIEEVTTEEQGAAPFGGKVPGMGKVHGLGKKKVVSGGALAGSGGLAGGNAVAPPVDAYAVASTTQQILEGGALGNVLVGSPPVATAEGGSMFEQWAYRIDRFHHPYTCMLLANLNRYGLPGVLAPAAGPLRRQLADEGVVMPGSEAPDPERDYRPIESFVAPPYPRDDFDFTPGGAYSVYNWELFVHAPLLIAERLRRDRRFEEAQRWYHFVFNPLQGVETVVNEETEEVEQIAGPERFWNAKPLFEQASGGPIDVIKAVMSDEGLDADPELVTSFLQSMIAWVEDPFSPHAIARWRAGTYHKAIVRKYLDNLIEWGDSLFRQDTMESINEATQIYLLAASILGPKPQRLPAIDAPVRTYDELTETWLLGGLVELESFVPAPKLALPWMGPAAIVQAGGGTLVAQGVPAATVPPPAPVWWAFCLPANEQLLAYWDRVGDRLFKIRNCMNIDGVKRALRLFEPPIDPALLVRARALGVDLGSVLADLSASAPLHRFAVLRGRAQELLGDVRALGGALLSALEKRDAEALGILRATHEVSLLKSNRVARTKQIEEAEAQVEALRRQQQTVQARHDYYASREAVSGLEATSLVLGGVATGFQAGAQAVGALAGLLHLIPDLDIGALVVMPHYKLRFGGNNIGPAVQAASTVLGMYATIAQYGASLTSTLAGYERRKDDWDFQAAQAKAELRQLDTQMAAAEIRVAMAKHELAQHDRQVEHSEEVETFLRSKFTSTELYDWMVGQVSGLYFQSYKLAHDMARRAEKALARELGRDDLVFIEPVYWDGLRKGLLAGERLALDLRRMEVAQLDLDRRELELTKRVSLRLLDPAALLTLRETGTCTFSVPEVAFDLDHPGHYFRRIKTVSLSIPAVAGPQVSVGAALTLLGDSTRVSASTAPAYIRQQPEDLRFRDGSEEQVIATSRGRDDAGVFELHLQGEKYLPFEGAGAVSSWRIELPTVRQFDYRTITDVELELRYTARDGGSTLRDAATAAVEDAIETIIAAGNAGGFVLLLSATKDFATEWKQLLRPAEGQEDEPLELPIVPEQFPYVLRSRWIEVDEVRIAFIGDASALLLEGSVPLIVPHADPLTITFELQDGLLSGSTAASPTAPFPMALDQAAGPWSLDLPATAIVDAARVQDLWVLVRYHVTTLPQA